MSANLRAAVLGLIAYGTYATQDALIKFLSGGYSPLQILLFSVLFGFPLATLMLVHDKTPDTLRPKNWLWVMLRSAGIVMGGVFGFNAFSMLTLAEAYTIFFTVPLLVTLLSIPMLGERVGWHRGAAVVVGFIGVLIALRPGAVDLGLGHLMGAGAASAVAFVAVVTRKIGPTERSVVLLIYPMLANVVLIGATMPFVYEPMPLPDLGLVALVALFSWLGALFTIRAFSEGEASIVVTMQYSQFIWALIYGILIFNERPDAQTMIGAAVIVGSGMYIIWRERNGGVSERRPASRAVRMETGILQRWLPRRMK